MGKRVLFTKRELQKLSKTHEGRQHINSTYIQQGKMYVGIGIAFSILSIISTAAFYSILSFMPLLGILPGIVFICIGAYQISSYKQEYQIEESNERQRIYEAQEKQRQLLVREREAEREKQQYLKRLKESNIEKVDSMQGFEFEEFVAAILSDLGYQTSTTKKSGDFGADIIVEQNGEKTIIQTKRYAQKVPVAAIQEISAAQNFYGIYNAWVITNNYFTGPAIKLAQANHIKLINRDDLISLILKAHNATESYSIETASLLLSPDNAAVTDSSFNAFQAKLEDTNNFSRKVHASQKRVLDFFNKLDIENVYKEFIYVTKFSTQCPQDNIPLHFFYIETAKLLHQLVYRDKKADEYCLMVCEEDFKILPIISSIMIKPYSCPTATVACIILERAGEYQKIIDYCDMFINLDAQETSGKSFIFRKERMAKKFSKNLVKDE